MSADRLCKLLAFSVLAMVFAPCAIAQATTTGAPQMEGATRSPAYAVVSVKPGQPGCGGMSVRGSVDSYRARCVTLWGLIYNAYKVRSFEDLPAGLPGWADKDTFDIDAKTDDETNARMEKLSGKERGDFNREMLQSILADRFQLRVHYEPKVLPIYELVLAKGGLKLKPLPADQIPGGMSGGRGELILHGMTLNDLAWWLTMSTPVGRTVVDKTGLAGRYEIDLKWAPDEQQEAPNAGPTLFTALGEQLGLKLHAARGPVDTLVVDHAEKPAAN